MKLAIYPGTFDPVTHGHLDILRRACRLFDEVLVAVAPNESKQPLFTVAERLELLKPHLKGLNVKMERLNGLTVDFARKHNAVALIRGLRAVSDFEYEFQMAQMNRTSTRPSRPSSSCPATPFSTPARKSSSKSAVWIPPAWKNLCRITCSRH